MKIIRSLVPVAIAAGFAISSIAALAASPEKGKTTFVKNGCWQCHGFVGQGGIAGPKLAPEPLPLEALTAFIRYTNGPMPPYPETILSNEELADIHAYLSSIPKAPDYRNLPLLK